MLNEQIRPQQQEANTVLIPAVVAITACVLAIALYSQNTFEIGQYGWLSLLPTLVVVAMALYTKRTIESLFVGMLVGVLMTSSISEFVPVLGGIFLDVFLNDTVAWIFIACGLMGSMIALVTMSGGAEAFGRWISKRVSSRSGTLFSTMGLGLLIFIDDYLNALTIGSSMRRATDRQNVPREFLAYVVDSTAAPVCIILPFSTWAVFFSGLLEENQVAAVGSGIDLFIQSIPYMFYAWICLAVVVLAILGLIPALGAMKVAETRTRETGKLYADEDKALNLQDAREPAETGMWNFFVPIAALIGFTWFFGVDILSGALAAIFLTIALYLAQRLMTLPRMFDAVLSGFVGMVAPLGTLFCGFMLAEVNDKLGTTQYVIEAASGMMTAQLLPVVVFLCMAGLAFATASFWGIFVVGMPIVFPLAQAVGADIPVVVGALISASAFGSHACFYGDSTVLSAKACGVSPMNHALTQLPYTLIAAALTAVVFYIIA
ncbi:MAG: Na+/H+ antiporter NhaC family protein [Granulosicoccaceae bacterium]